MDIVMSIIPAGSTMHTSRMMMDVGMVLMGEALDLAEVQGGAVQEMMELSFPSFHVLDMYA